MHSRSRPHSHLVCVQSWVITGKSRAQDALVTCGSPWHFCPLWSHALVSLVVLPVRALMDGPPECRRRWWRRRRRRRRPWRRGGACSIVTAAVLPPCRRGGPRVAFAFALVRKGELRVDMGSRTSRPQLHSAASGPAGAARGPLGGAPRPACHVGVGGVGGGPTLPLPLTARCGLRRRWPGRGQLQARHCVRMQIQTPRQTGMYPPRLRY